MSPINFRSIRFNLFILVLLIFIPFFALILQSANNQKIRIHKIVLDNMLSISRHLSEQQKFVEENTCQLLTVLSQLPEIQSVDTLKVNKLLASLLQQNPIYASLFVADINGNVKASGNQYYKINISDRKYFQDVIARRKFSVGEYTKSRLTQKPVIHYAYPVLDQNGTLISVIVASFDLQYFDRFLKTINLGKDAGFTFIDQKGVIIFRSPNDFYSAGTNEYDPIFSKLKQKDGEGSFISKDKEGTSKIYGFQRLYMHQSEPYMYVYVTIPESIAFLEYHKTLSQNMILWLIAAFFVSIVAFVFSFKYIIRPIDLMVHTAGLIADGNLETKTDIGQTSNELGKLAVAIDSMTVKLLQRENERNKAVKDLKKLKERFELAINSAKIGIWDLHIKTNSLIWDSNMFDLYGVNLNEFENTYESWMRFIHIDDIQNINEKIKNAITNELPFRSEFRIIHPITGIKNIRIFASIIKDKEDKPARLIGVNWDITERKLLEIQLHEAKEKAEKNDRLKSVFFADISHEIRTPLHGIIGFAQILKDNDISIQEKLQYLDIIINSGNKLLSIISNIIDISLIDAGQLKLMKKECDISKIVSEIYYYYDKIRLKENKQFQLILDTENINQVVYLVDGFRLNQIFNNLLDNAFKHTEKGVIRMGYKIIDNQLSCFVKDTTIILDNLQLHRIFDKFRSLDDISGTNYSGNGLDLAICKGLVELMGGTMWANNLNDQTEFFFNLPLSSIEAEQENALCQNNVSY